MKSEGRGELFSGDISMPGGRTLAECVQQTMPFKLPLGFLGWVPPEQQSFSNARRHIANRDQFLDENLHLKATEPETAELFRASALGSFGREHGLPFGYKPLNKLEGKVGAGQKIDRRAGNAGRKPTPLDPRVREAFLDLALHQNFKTLAEPWRHARDVADKLGLPIKSLRWFQQWFPANYPEWAVNYCKRPRQFESDNLPKIARQYTEVDPLEWISLDGHVLNIMCQAPDAAKTGRKLRPVLTGVLDVRSRMFVGTDIRATENSDGILAGLMQMHRDYGCARHYYCDNGEAYKASVGARFRRKLFDDPRIGGLCAQTGAQRHNAIPYQGWSKMIESHWRFVVERFARYFTGWWGNRIEARPEGAEKIPVWELPTVDDVRAAWAEFVLAHHAEPQHGHGMYGLSPAEAMGQFRTELRRLDDDVLRFLCSRSLIKPRRVGRDGVRLDGVLYGTWDQDVFKLQGRKVIVRLDPADAGYVWLYDPQSRDVVIAHNRQLTGATREDVRDAARHRAKFRRLARQYMPERDFLLTTTTQQIMRKKRQRAEARAATRAAELPTPADPPVTLVRPDLVEPVKRAKQAEQRGAVKRALQPASDGPPKPAPDSFERLAQAVAPPPPEPDLPDPLDRFADQLAAARSVPDDDVGNIWDRHMGAAG